MNSTAAVATFSGRRRRARRAALAQLISKGSARSLTALDLGERLLLRHRSAPAGGDLGLGLVDGRKQLRIAEDRERLLERLQVLQAEHDGGRTAVLGDDHSAVLVFEAV